jgi:hypothetical protein
METMRESWTDARLDDFRAETARRFDSLERRTEDGFDRVDGRIDDLTREMNSRFDSLNRTLLQIGGGLIGTGVVGFLGLIATQL